MPISQTFLTAPSLHHSHHSSPTISKTRPHWRCCKPSPPPPTPSDPPAPLPWKDRIALYAQFSPEETLESLLQALRQNSPTKDDGIDALYIFANLDIWALTHTFFGRKMDLGQFERFKRVLVASPYNAILRSADSSTLSALRLSPDIYITRRVFQPPEQQPSTFIFTLSRTTLVANPRLWMVDSIIHEPLSDPPSHTHLSHPPRP